MQFVRFCEIIFRTISNSSQPEGPRWLSATILHKKLWPVLTECAFQLPLSNRSQFPLLCQQTGFKTAMTVINEIAKTLGIPGPHYLIPYKRPLQRYQLSQFARCHPIVHWFSSGRWLHIWTTVTYLDDGGCISGRVLRIWTVKNLHMADCHTWIRSHICWALQQWRNVLFSDN